jgi:hypothetical protein
MDTTSARAKIPEEHQELIRTSLESKLNAITRYEDISWKIRSGYVVILYGALTLLVGKELTQLASFAANTTTAVSVCFLILGLSLSSFAVDLGYLMKKLRVVVLRDILVEVFYDPDCHLRAKLPFLLHVAAERPLKTHFRGAHTTYLKKLRWNLLWILLPIYATTPALSGVVYFVHRVLAK